MIVKKKKKLFQGTGKILIILLIISGINITQWMGQPQPFWWEWCLNNKFYACIMLFFICNAVEGQLISSGAFEIHFNGLYNSLNQYIFPFFMTKFSSLQTFLYGQN